MKNSLEADMRDVITITDLQAAVIDGSNRLIIK
jgi:hypothetical protein